MYTFSTGIDYNYIDIRGQGGHSHPLENVRRGSGAQLQVGENLNYFILLANYFRAMLFNWTFYKLGYDYWQRDRHLKPCRRQILTTKVDLRSVRVKKF